MNVDNDPSTLSPAGERLPCRDPEASAVATPAQCGSMRAGDPLATFSPTKVADQLQARTEGIIRMGDPVGGRVDEPLIDGSNSLTD
ncbi:hypothetical protein [Paraburkholderia sp. RL17-337-BIB-A]|uniref:hypothetical protein n=1 Tax=Paraburkholderia sp. RL17-337-BIB-A TaxID=3031636 RepID=UPI0038BCA820